MLSLKTALTAEQVAAATRLHARLTSWRATDAALDLLAQSVPGFDLSACLIKAAAINQLYGTNVYALTRVGAHVAGVMATPDGDQLVERLAAVSSEGRVRRHLSFASKFAHFFVDKDRFPIFDSYAVRGLRHHLDGTRLPYDDPPAYADYVEALCALTALSGLECSGRELDRYLWLSGLYRAWRRDAEAQINVEARDLFIRAEREPEIRGDLLRLVSDSP